MKGSSKKLPCVICENDKSKLVERVKHAGRSFSIYQCTKCFVMHQHPLPSKSQLKSFYKQIYNKECNFPCAEQAFEDFNVDQEEKRLKEIERYKKKGRLLDVGASSGFFLSVVKQKKRWNPYGVEYVKKVAEKARRDFRLKMYHGEIFDVPRKNYFDVVTMHSVLEHLPDPVGAVSEVRKKIKKGGIFVFNVPNIESFEYKLYKSLNKPFAGFIYEHLYYYSVKSIIMLLEKNGFKIKKITSQHHSRLSLPPKRPLIGILTFPPKLFLEYTMLGGRLKKGNILYVYAEAK